LQVVGALVGWALAATAVAQVDTAWVRRYDGTGNGHDIPRSLSVDATGNVHVTGFGLGTLSFDDYETVKYDPNGNLLWAERYNGTGDSVDIAWSMAIDSDGNCCVTGWSGGGESKYDFATVKYAPDGDTLWVRRYDGDFNQDEFARAMDVDTAGNIYVTGQGWGGTARGFLTIKYNSDGDTLWVRRHLDPNSTVDNARLLQVDPDGNVLVSGTTMQAGGSIDFQTVKYNGDGDTLWARVYDGPAGKRDEPQALTVDADGNVYVAGARTASNDATDYATLKYDPNGNLLWAAQYNGPADTTDHANDVQVDGDGNV
jgi:uncharacterized delta-60 repeat protein